MPHIQINVSGCVNIGIWYGTPQERVPFMPFNKVSDTDVAVRVISTVVAVQVEHTVVLVLAIVTAYV